MKILTIDSKWFADHVWPIGITLALLVVVAVNMTFVAVAVGGADEVVESYEAGER